MAYNKKEWKNKGENGATDSNSKLDKNAMNDLENRIQNGFNKKVNKNGDTLSGALVFDNNSFDTIIKNRTINNKEYQMKLGLFNRSNKGAIALQLIDKATGNVISQFDLADDYTRMPPVLVDDSKNDFLALRKERTIGSDSYYANFGIAANGAALVEIYKNDVGVGRFDVMPNGTMRNGKTGQVLIEGDTGWQDLTLKDGISVGSVLKKAQYRKVGKIVYIRGDVSGVAKAGTILSSIPIGYRPSIPVYSINSCAGTRICRVYLNIDGTLVLEWVNDGSYNLTWYNINMVFMVD